MQVHAGRGNILTQLFDMGSFLDDLPLQVFNKFLLLCNSFLKTTFFVPQLQYLFFALVVNRQNLHLYSVDIHTQLLTQALVQLLYAVVAYCK